MPDIVLATLNARYAHCAFGLRYLMANLGPLQPRAQIMEFDINQRVADIAERILQADPKIVGLGVYIWNVRPSTQLVADLKRLRPDLVVIIGGPEVSYELDSQPICRDADFVLTGEADLAFAHLCRHLLEDPLTPLPKTCNNCYTVLANGEGRMKIVAAGPPPLHEVSLPYDRYTDEDIAHRVIYVEASRGCPFECEFCLSSLDIPVRSAPLEPFLAAMQSLLDRGCRQFKFVDRTFNLNLKTSAAILQFFLQRYRPGLFVHFEMIPDRLPAALRELIAQFPAGALQLEVGIQTFNPRVAELIGRRQDNAKAEENLRWLRQHSGVHVHADLIVGLPGEDVESFAAGFDRLVALGPQEIQVGMLKRLRGAPISRHDAPWAMVYASEPPYEILQNKLIDFATMQRLRRFARYWDLVVNSGDFAGLSWTFESFLRFSDWLYAQTGQTHAIALPRLAELLGRYLGQPVRPQRTRAGNLPPRQARHLAAPPSRNSHG